MKIAIASLFAGKCLPLMEVTRQERQDYCDRHGYVYIEQEGAPSSRHPSWDKVQLIWKNLSKFDAMCWIDADALVLHPEKSLDMMLSQPGNFIVQSNHEGINCGAFILKTSAWAYRFMSAVWDYPMGYWERNWEQDAIVKLMKESREIRDGVKVVGTDEIADPLQSFVWWPGDRSGIFLHFAGVSLHRDVVAEMKTTQVQLLAQRAS